MKKTVTTSPYWVEGSYLSAKCCQALKMNEAAEAIKNVTRQFVSKFSTFSSAKFQNGEPFLSETVSIWLEENEASPQELKTVEQELNNFDEILAESDGIMVARGDLGVEIPVEEVPCAQKMMIRKCNRAGKAVITATQMLDSMIKNPRPTRAEANDVANAILDGTDAVMLSGETAKGKYPLAAVEVMNKIAKKVDATIPPFYVEGVINKHDITTAVAEGSADISERLNAKLIVVGTESGRAARDMRRYFPKANILAEDGLIICEHHLLEDLEDNIASFRKTDERKYNKKE